MKISVVVTVLNEGKTIVKLLDSILDQTQKADEVVIIDAGSFDNTVEIIRHYQKKENRINLLIEPCSRAKGRNLGIEIANNEIIAMTDAGCVAKKDWLEKLTASFSEENIGVVAGFYDMKAENSFERACRRFLGVYPDEFDVNFLPSTRSIAFRKSAWEKVGGFPEKLNDTAEDTIFSYKLVKEGVKIAREKDARVEWMMPRTRKEFFEKIKGYAKGDIKSGLLWHPSKGIASHNIKAFSVFFRYIIFITLFIFSIGRTFLFLALFLILVLYSIYSFLKVYKKENDLKVGLYGVINQFIADFAVISGVISGIRFKVLKK